MLVELNIVVVILKTDNQDIPDLIDLEAKWANKMKEKAERRRQRKIYLAKATVASSAPLSPDISACYLPSSIIVSASSASSTSAGDAGNMSAKFILSSTIADDCLLSIVLVCFLSPVISSSLLSIVFGCLLSPVACDGLFSTISGRLLFHLADGGPLFAISGGDSFSPMSFIGSRTLFLTSTPSCVHLSSLPSLPLFHSFLPVLPTPLACNPTLLTRKRSFN